MIIHLAYIIYENNNTYTWPLYNKIFLLIIFYWFQPPSHAKKWLYIFQILHKKKSSPLKKKKQKWNKWRPPSRREFLVLDETTYSECIPRFEEMDFLLSSSECWQQIYTSLLGWMLEGCDLLTLYGISKVKWLWNFVNLFQCSG